MSCPGDKLPTYARFGTSGARGVISDDLTFVNVPLVAQGVADYFAEQGQGQRGFVIGFDTCPFSDRYAIEVSRLLAANGIQAYLNKYEY